MEIHGTCREQEQVNDFMASLQETEVFRDNESGDLYDTHSEFQHGPSIDRKNCEEVALDFNVMSYTGEGGLCEYSAESWVLIKP